MVTRVGNKDGEVEGPSSVRLVDNRPSAEIEGPVVDPPDRKPSVRSV